MLGALSALWPALTGWAAVWLASTAAGVAADLAITAEAGTVAGRAPFQDCADCPQMVVIPAGRFVMGTGAERPNEGPPLTVEIAEPFAIGRFEVTFREWDACVADDGCSHRPDDHGWGRDQRPVINVTHGNARSYAVWLSERTGRRYRLPSEAEWAYANRGNRLTRFWWGDDVGAGFANCRGCGGSGAGTRTMPVGKFPANPFGLHDTTGNVLEWVLDCWKPSLAGQPKDGRARIDQTPMSDSACHHRVLRGGSWYYLPSTARSAWRSRTHEEAGGYAIGFRVARDIRAADVTPNLQ